MLGRVGAYLVSAGLESFYGIDVHIFIDFLGGGVADDVLSGLVAVGIEDRNGFVLDALPSIVKGNSNNTSLKHLAWDPVDIVVAGIYPASFARYGNYSHSFGIFQVVDMSGEALPTAALLELSDVL